MIAALAPFAVLLVCAVPWLLLASARFGVLLAGLSVFTSLPLLILAVFLTSSPIGIAPLALLLPTAGVLGLLGGYLLLRRRSPLRAPSRAAVALWLPSTLGGVAWLVTLIIARLLPKADALSWAMNGDSANNIHLARQQLAENGLALPTSIPVPLPNTLLAVAMSLGRPEGAAASELLHHDLDALGVFWALAIAVTAVLLGLVAGSLLDRRRPALIAIASASGSLLGATWFIAGLPIDSGYLNVHVTLPLVLASWLAFLQSRRRPLLSAILVVALGIPLLATWTPLITVTIALALVIAVRNRPRRIGKPGPGAVILALAIVLLLAWLLTQSIPSLSVNAVAFSTPGHGYPLTGVILAVLFTVAAGGTLLLRREIAEPLLDGLIALFVAVSLAIGTLLIMTYEPEPWTAYYPTKLTWLFTVLLLAIALSVVMRLAARFPFAPLAVTVVGATTVALCTLGPAPARESFTIVQPLDRILSSKVWNNGDESVRAMLGYTGLDHAVVLWDSASPDEAMINFWLFDFGGGEYGGGDPAVRAISFAGYREFRDTGSYSAPSVDVLCELIEGLDRDVVVVTTNAQLEYELGGACPFASVSVTRE